MLLLRLYSSNGGAHGDGGLAVIVPKGDASYILIGSSIVTLPVMRHVEGEVEIAKELFTEISVEISDKSWPSVGINGLRIWRDKNCCCCEFGNFWSYLT